MSLEGYLADQYNRDTQDIKSIERVLVEVANMFADSFDEKTGSWPYRLTADDVKPAGNVSHGTSAMILAAIGKVVRRCTLRDGVSAEELPGLSPTLVKIFTNAIDSLAQQLETAKIVDSGTFGPNNPLTFSHIAELARGLSKEGKPSTVPTGAGADELEKAVGRYEVAIKKHSNVTDKIAKLMAIGPANEKEFLRILDKEWWCVKSAFVALRVLQINAVLQLADGKSVLYKEFFEAKLHEQLSFSSIPDSRFDPAELAFCLEGLLICGREAVDPVLFERVFTVLRAEQETSAYWRPNRPFIAKKTGEIILPISVEGANSILRSVEIMDGDKLHNVFAAAAVPMFRRFWQWLRARKVEINASPNARVGWHSEHINEAGVIDLWDTSQVVEFLLAFRKLLQRHIARETLVLSRVKIEEPKGRELWKKMMNKFEPLTDESISKQVFAHIEKDFVQPWLAASPSNYSMLVYGPPGTGKTTIASSIANALGFRLVTVTVSDFLGAGGALVEARAKAIFQMLEAQSNCVILFDEIDAFLLDRDSKHYRDQDTLFQFLTPGMLTKINDLRKVERSIFIVSMNYANRVDPAVKRPGRVDRQYLLLPPDLAKRQAIIQEALNGMTVTPAESEEMAKASLYLGYKEITGVISQLAKPTTADNVTDALRRARRSSSHQHYLARIPLETTFPDDELVAMAKLALQAEGIDEVKSDIDRLAAENRKALKECPGLEAKFFEIGIQL